ncbi:hypothetical protein ETAA8_36060 [Anatilimnocola aggregata]|uniref:Uncharacterized protein n=1 Tax=Anatilimnocola aggregata TaxID=2528021 RepID=A0A517YE47_9BACT|nr:HEAT repeat domain-containing protein [Anatilimnocola aggregata]QDU28505.1 hypothetical protein ETAA8_36060 [Anatilimnocola aggregata]
MSGTVVCPACKHSFPKPGIQPGAVIRCERCFQPFLPKSIQASTPTPEPQQSQLVLTPLAPLQPLQPLSPFAPAPTLLSQPGYREPPQPVVAKSSRAPIILGCLALSLVLLVFCGGTGVLAYRFAGNLIAKVEHESGPGRNIKVNTIPVPESEARKMAKERMNGTGARPADFIAPPKQKIPQPENVKPYEGVRPQLAPPPYPQVPEFGRPDLMPPSPVRPPFTRPNPAVRPVPRQPQTDSEKLDQILAQLNDPASGRPAWFSLTDLNRLPVMEERRAEVSAVLNQQLRSSDPSSQRAAAEAVRKWGTEDNIPVLLELLNSPGPTSNREVIQALVELSPTKETAAALIAKFDNFSNRSAIQSALVKLGPVAEEPVIARLENAKSIPERMSLIQLLGNIGEEASVELLERMANGNDFLMKSTAKNSLDRIKARMK